MTQQARFREFRRSALALAVSSAIAAVPAAQAQEKKDEPAPNPVETQASIEAGAIGVSGDSKDRAFWGQYNGMRYQDAYGIANFDYSRRDTSTGTWLEIVGSNLGLQTREIGLQWLRQGDWKLFADYGELWAVNPYSVNSGVANAGTTAPTATYLTGGPGSGYDQSPATKRKAFTLGGSKWFDQTYQLEANVKSENKTGSQLFGVGNTCPGTVASGCGSIPGQTAGFGILTYPMPIDYNHTQAEARVTYAGQQLQLSGGYYGSFFTNENGALYPGVPSTLNNAVGQPLPAGLGVPAYLGQQVALAPESQFNSFDITGSYAFMPELRANFKVAYSQGRQDQDFASAGLIGAPAGVGSLDGEVATTLAQVRLVGNPIADLSLVAEYRYADNDDKTPVVFYNQVGTVAFTNQTTSREVSSGKLEATYRFPWSIQGLAGVGFNSIDRTYTPTASYTGVSAVREETDETSWWIEVRRSMSETISGSIRYQGSSRDGSNWLAPASGGVGLTAVTNPAAQLGPNAIYMPTLADLDRTKLRLLINWMATDSLSLQFAIDYGKDDYSAPTQFALQESKFDLYTLDVNYAIADGWNLNGYVSAGKQTLNQARPQGYILAFEDTSLAAGVGFNGKASEKLQVGGLVSYVSNEDRYVQSLGPNAGAGLPQLLAVTGGLPDIVFRRLDVRLFGSYALSERSTLRADAAYQRLTYDDWGFNYNGVPFLYSDNSTVYLQPNQNVGYLGVSYVYSWK